MSTQRIDKAALPLDKPRRTPDHPTKSHVVKTKVDGQERIIRFGEQGASTAGKPKEGESQAMKDKRASFKARHAKNIAKGKSSPAYWADKVKWADGGLVAPFAKGGQAEMRAIPRSAGLGRLADALKRAQEFTGQYQVLPSVPLLGGTGVDELLGLPGAAREVENWAYGNYPVRVNPYAGRTASFVPEIKPGRKSDVFDTALLGADLTGVGALAGKYGVRGLTAAGRAGERVAERVVPQVMERGGFGAQALQDLALGSRSQVIKPKGGNWLAGAGEIVEPMKRDNAPILSGEIINDASGRDLFSEYRKVYDLDPTVGLHDWMRATHPDVYAQIQNPEDRVINRWLDQKLGKYIKNEMATPEDPLRLQADAFAAKKAEQLAAKDAQIAKARADMEAARQSRGFTPEMMTSSQARIRQLQRERDLIEAKTGLHYTPNVTADVTNMPFLREDRRLAGFPGEGVAGSDAARRWEAASDLAVIPRTAREYRGTAYADENPWLEKVDPATVVYDVNERSASGLGFDHMVDELKNALRPDSDLPENLRVSAKDLDKMTVSQVSKLVDDINAWRAVSRAEADEALAANAATQVFKEYPEQGVKWVELKAPDVPEGWQLPEGYEMVFDPTRNKAGEVVKEGYRLKSPTGEYLSYGSTPEEAIKEVFSKKDLEEALKYEGSSMGHCVGGYCQGVFEGHSRIFSLRDDRGRPQVTIEVAPAQARSNYEEMNAIYNQAQREANEGGFNTTAEYNDFYHNRVKQLHMEMLDNKAAEMPQRIVQIKGPKNQAPDEKYLPMVQDFVRSQQWSDVGDIKNTGMRATQDVFSEGELARLREAGEQNIPHILSGQDIQRLHNLITPEGRRLKYDAKGNVVGAEDGAGYAAGGLVGLGQKYAEGGKVSHPATVGLPAPNLLNLNDYSRVVAENMFPENPEQRDAARHLIASALAAQKTSPGVAEALGKLYEFKEAPFRTGRHWLGLGEPRADYRTDVHNNALGAQLGRRARSLDELLSGVERAVESGVDREVPGRASLRKDADVRYARGGEVRAYNPRLIDALVSSVETPGFAAGGEVRAYNPAVVDALVNQILEG